jgi:hypothetical protein
MVVLKANAVLMQREKLLLDAVEDMVTSSTNPSVAAIALESLAGTTSPADVPMHLWWDIRSALGSMCPSGRSGELSEHQTAVGERLSRALSLAVCVSTDHILIGRFLDRSLHNPRIMALEGLCIARRLLPQRLDGYMENILKQPSIDMRLLHPLVHCRIVKGMTDSKAWSPPEGDCKLILRSFASNLSPDQPPTLQEEIMFHHLHRVIQMQESESGMNLSAHDEVRNLLRCMLIDDLRSIE